MYANREDFVIDIRRFNAKYYIGVARVSYKDRSYHLNQVITPVLSSKSKRQLKERLIWALKRKLKIKDIELKTGNALDFIIDC